MLPYLTEVCPSLATKQVTPHTRHTALAMWSVMKEKRRVRRAWSHKWQMGDGEAAAKLLWVFHPTGPQMLNL